MAQLSALAKPSLGKAILEAMRNAGEDAPGYRELDGTTYRVLDFHGEASVPSHLSRRFVGAIAEWANDAERLTGLTLYESLDEFGSDYARINIVADKI